MLNVVNLVGQRYRGGVNGTPPPPLDRTIPNGLLPFNYGVRVNDQWEYNWPRIEGGQYAGLQFFGVNATHPVASATLHLAFFNSNDGFGTPNLLLVGDTSLTPEPYGDPSNGGNVNATIELYTAMPTTWEYDHVDVTAMVNELLALPAWVSGGVLSFIIYGLVAAQHNAAFSGGLCRLEITQ